MIASTQPSPNDVALELTGRNYLSYSGVTAYRRCPLAYSLRYVHGLPEESVSASLLFGGAVHSAAEHHFNELMAGNPPPDLDELLSAFWESWRARAEDVAIQFGKGEDINAIGQLADRVLRTFRESDVARPQDGFSGSKRNCVDRSSTVCPIYWHGSTCLVETGDKLVVIDLKTARSRWSAEQAHDNAEQLLLYSELARHLAPKKNVFCQFIVVTKAKMPVVEQHTVAMDAERVERTKAVVERVWRAIEAGHFYPTPSPIACNSCPYRTPCQVWPDITSITTDRTRESQWNPP